MDEIIWQETGWNYTRKPTVGSIRGMPRGRWKQDFEAIRGLKLKTRRRCKEESLVAGTATYGLSLR
jgi:hypothetical protein